MHYWNKKPEKMIGYTRVSSLKQAEGNQSLRNQEEQIRTYCRERSLRLLGVFQDTASASGKGSHLQRPDLLAALKEAREQQSPILVTGLDRLSRDPTFLTLPEVQGLEFFSIEVGGRATRKEMREAFRSAKVEAEQLASRGRMNQATIQRVNGKKGFAGPAAHIRRSGSINNMVRSDMRCEELIDYLESHPKLFGLGARRLSRELNARGYKNSGRGARRDPKDWTRNSLHRLLQAAREEIAFRDLMDQESHNSNV